MLRLLLALFLVQAAAQAADNVLEANRCNLRPSLVEVSKRVLTYAAKGDFERANKAAKYLEPIYAGLEKEQVLPPKTMIPLAPKLKAKDVLGIRESLRRMILADIHYLLSGLNRAPTKGGLHPRTRLLMAQQDWKFLEATLPKTKEGDKVKLAIGKLLQALIQTVPNKSNYNDASGSWEQKAELITKNILQLLDQAILPPPPDKEEENG